MDAGDWVSVGAAVIALFAAIVAFVSWRSQERLSKNMFKRAGVIELHNAWSNVSDINVSQLITPDVIKAVNALNLTAALWLHDIIEREILYQSYWESYKQLYEKMHGSHVTPPGLSKTLNDHLSPPIRTAYEEMGSFDKTKRAVGTRI